MTQTTKCPHCDRTDRHSHRVIYPPLAPERPLYPDQPGYVPKEMTPKTADEIKWFEAGYYAAHSDTALAGLNCVKTAKELAGRLRKDFGFDMREGAGLRWLTNVVREMRECADAE